MVLVIAARLEGALLVRLVCRGGAAGFEGKFLSFFPPSQRDSLAQKRASTGEEVTCSHFELITIV